MHDLCLTRSGPSSCACVTRRSLLDNVCAEPPLCLVLVVRAAAELEVLGRRLAAISKGDDVVDLEEPTFGAAAVGAHERASAFVAPPDFPPYGRRDVPRVALCRPGRSRLPCLRELPLFEVLDETAGRVGAGALKKTDSVATPTGGSTLRPGNGGGSLRTVLGTAGCGCTSATRRSTSRLL